jgi:hypothetical protein
MNRDEAKLILQAWRPGGRDAGDPYFAEALALVEKDAELSAWFVEQQAFDARIIGSMQQVRVPSRLKAKILAKNKTRPAPLLGGWREFFARQSPAAWAVATVILAVLGVTLLRVHSPLTSAFADYSAQMVNTAMTDQHHVDWDVSDLKTALASLSSDLAENDLALPSQLEKGIGLKGCRALQWHGQKVSMLCFMPKAGGHVDVFMTAAAIFPDAPPKDQPRFAVSNGSPIASWTHNGETYLAVGHGDETILKNLWSPEQAGAFKPITWRRQARSLGPWGG